MASNLKDNADANNDEFLRLFLFAGFFFVWALLTPHFYRLDPFFYQGDLFFKATFPFMCAALYMTRSRSNMELAGLCLVMILFFIVYAPAYQEIDILPSSYRMKLLLAAVAAYFIFSRSFEEHKENLAAGTAGFLIFFCQPPPFYPNGDPARTLRDFLIFAWVYLFIKRRRDILRPILFFSMLFVPIYFGDWQIVNTKWIHCLHVRSGLENVAFAEKYYFKEFKVYTKNFNQLGLDPARNAKRGVSIAITKADAQSFRMIGFHELCDKNGDGLMDFIIWDSALGGGRY